MAMLRQMLARRRARRLGDRRDRGATAVEYGLITALFVGGMFGVIGLLNTALQSSYSTAESRVAPAPSRLAAPSLPPYSPPVCDPDTEWYNNLTGVCDPIPTCSAGYWYNSGTNQCDVVPSCNPSTQWYNSVSNQCDTKASCSGSQWYNSATNQCDAVPDCTGQWYNVGTNQCNAIPSCNVTTEWYNSGTNTCDASQRPTCLASSQGYDSVNNTCVACTASQWFNAGTVACDTKVTCIGMQTWNSSNNTCTLPTCTAAQWYNSATGNCDAKVVCIGQQTWDSLTNTCTPPVCTAVQWYNSGTGNCDVKTVCIGEQTFNNSNNTCTPPSCTVNQWYDAATGNCVAKGPYTGPRPNNRYPASGNYNAVQGTTFDVDTLFSVPGITYTASSCARNGSLTSGCSRSSFSTATGVITFNGNFGSRGVRYTITWQVPASATELAGTGTFSVYFN